MLINPNGGSSITSQGSKPSSSSSGGKGSSSGGSGGSGKNGGNMSYQASLFNPIGTIASTITGNKELEQLDPFGQSMAQATQNLFNVWTGKEQFGSHENWVGQGVLGDIINPILGGKSTAQKDAEAKNKAEWDKYYKAQQQKQKLWQDFFKKSLLS